MSYKLFPLSQPQKRIWLTQNVYPYSPLYNIGGTVAINGCIDMSLLQEAIKLFVSEHDAFHIRIIYKENTPMQFFCREKAVVNIMDFSEFGEDAEKQYKKWENKQARTSFKMINSPLFKFAVIKISDNIYGYFIKLHHIIADGWSIQILTKKIHENYLKLKYATRLSEENNCQYKDYLFDEQQYLESASYNKDKQYWLDLLDNIDYNSNDTQRFLDGTRSSFPLPEDVVMSVRALCKKNKFSLNTFFISIYALYLYKKYGQTDFVIGIPVLGRTRRKQYNIFGMLVSTIPLLLHIEQSQTFIELAHDINKRIFNSYKHQRYPYNHLILEKGLHGQSLYSASVNYYGTKLDYTFDGYSVTNTEFYSGQQPYDFQMIVREWQGEKKIQIDIDTANSVYTYSQINEFISDFMKLISCFVSEPTKFVKGLREGLEGDSSIIRRYNQTQKNIRTNITIVDLFETAAEQYADRIAVECEGQVYTYEQFYAQILKFCSFLTKREVEPGSVVGVIATHSVDMLVAIWGIVVYGCVLLPIEPKTPTARQSFMLEDASVHVLFTNIPTLDLPRFRGVIYEIHEIEVAQLGKTNPQVNPEQLAYVMYTSGSTGQPKGVQVSHKNLLNYICWAKKQYITVAGGQEAEVFALFTSIAFDLTVTTLFTPLIIGSKIIIYPEYENEYSLFRILDENRCTVIKLTPSHLSLIRDRIESNSSIRRFIVGGEVLKSSLARSIYRNWGENIEIVNEYGPTEATVGCMSHRFDLQKDIFDSVPIGRPIWNTQIYLLDKNMQEVPIGEIGEIYIAGDSVTQGYMNCPELTNKSFVFWDVEGSRKRLYRTGDRAKFLDNDTMMYCGRLDSQVKIRGYRIELQEIESAILKNSAVDEAHVTVLDNDCGTKHLCGYYTSKKGLQQEELRLFLQKNVQQYMIPTWLIYMDNFPLNNNGKLDSDLLPKPQIEGSVKDSDHSPLLDICAKVLGIKGIRLDDNFYNLGGSSISAIQISSKLRENKLILSVKSILENPIFRDMEACIEKQENTLSNQDLCTGDIESTPIVNWFFTRPFKNPNTYYQELQLKLTRPIDVVTLEEVLKVIIRHHDILRVNVSEEKRLFYNNEHLKKQLQIEEIECSEKTGETFEHIIEKSKKKILSEMDLTSGLLLRSCLVSMGEERVWCILIHHLVVDGISLRVLLEDITESLRSLLKGQDIGLPMKTSSYKEYAEGLEKGRVANYARYVSDTQTAVPEEQQIAIQELDQEMTQILLRDANRRYSTKPVELLLAGLFHTLYGNENAQSQWELQLEGHGRENDKCNVTRTIGWFTHLISQNIDHIPDNMEECIIYAKETYRKMMNIGNVYISKMCERNGSQRSIRFNYLGEFRTKYVFFIAEPVFSLQNELIETMELDMVVVNRKILMCIRMRSDMLCGFQSADDFLSKFIQNIKSVLEFCCRTCERCFTPSDFGLVNISKKELDQLFL